MCLKGVVYIDNSMVDWFGANILSFDRTLVFGTKKKIKPRALSEMHYCGDVILAKRNN